MIRSCITPSFIRLQTFPTIFSQKRIARFTLEVLRKDHINGTNKVTINDDSYSLTSNRDHSALSNIATGIHLQYSHNTHVGTCSATSRNIHDSIYFGRNGTNNEKHSNSFLIRGRQPTTRELANFNDIEFEGLDVRKSSNDCVLPILDASVILAPGQYCKKSSKSGVHAAQRLVNGRRAFEQLLLNELLTNANVCDISDNDNKNHVKNDERVRKIYVLVGHGVPLSLFEHFVSTGREWLGCPLSTAGRESASHTRYTRTQTQSQSKNSAIQISLCSISKSTLIDPDKTLITSSNGTTSLIHWPLDWGHDLELYMVVMNRICSRLSSVVMRHATEKEGHERLLNPGNVLMTDNLTLGTGSVIIPSSLLQWAVTIQKGEMLPFHLLPSWGAISSSHREVNPSILSVEWIRNGLNCWKLVLRLQNYGVNNNNSMSAFKRDSISLMFEGVYESP